MVYIPKFAAWYAYANAQMMIQLWFPLADNYRRTLRAGKDLKDIWLLLQLLSDKLTPSPVWANVYLKRGTENNAS